MFWAAAWNEDNLRNSSFALGKVNCKKKQDLQFPIWSTLPISISFILISKNCPPVFNLCRDFHLTISHSGLRFDFAFPHLLLFSCWRLVAGRSSWKFSHELFCLLQNLSEYLPHHQPSMVEPTYQDLKWKWLWIRNKIFKSRFHKIPD